MTADRVATFAEGMATRVTFDLTFGILQRELNDIVTLTEEELADGVRLALEATHSLAEGAGAATLAAAVKLRDRLRGKRVVCVMSGGNIDRATLTRILESGLRAARPCSHNSSRCPRALHRRARSGRRIILGGLPRSRLCGSTKAA